VIAMVVQPGVEFGDLNVNVSRRDLARELCASARRLPGMVLEGYSTDCQSAPSPREPFDGGSGVTRSDLRDVLDRAMRDDGIPSLP
jgi:D-tagatose-1,6-bisphosphate aldolase subunit GatZ/KbaZ